MASPILTKDEQNFIRFVKICLDVFRLPLADILASEIQPADLYNKIQQHSCSLLNGKNKLDSKQEKICFRLPPAIPDYNEFDVTLLYKLIRNLCPSLAPTKGWGKDPADTDIQIGDDIERLRVFRNNNIHEVSSKISDTDFEIIWKKLKFVLQRIRKNMASKGYIANYEENMTKIKQLNLGDEHIDTYKIAFLERKIDQLQVDGMENPKISIKGPTSVLCGNNAKFTADINPENPKGWSVTWEKVVQQTSIRINSSKEKYSGSTDKSLVIRHVCKGDTGGYRAILSRDSEEEHISVLSKVIVLHATGGPPIFEVWDVTTGMDGVRIHYGFKKRPPDVTEIKWIKDEVSILKKDKKYEGGKLNDRYFTIISPTIEDRGNYSCVVENAVGSVQKDVQLDVPKVEILTEQEVYFGSKTSFTSRIISCPSPDGAEWQQSNDGKTFKIIIISKPKYYGSSCDSKSPLLIIPKVTFEDKLYYRLLVWNKIGEQYSNTVFLDVKGSLPNITISHRTCVLDRSVTLIGNVFLYGSLPAVKNVFWTKNGEELDTKGSGGRYSEVTVDNPSLTIFEVNEYDAGSYQLTATNAVGSTTSDTLILDVPDVSMAKPEKKNSGFWFTVTIQSTPAPYFAQWSIKEKSSETFIPIDENAEEFKGTTNTLPHPVLVVNPKTDLADYCFQIEVRNFIGSFIKITTGEGSSDDSFTNGSQGGLSKIYLDGGAGLKFAKLFDDIAELFPEKKTRRLKDFIQNSQNCKDITRFAETVTARDCLEILRDHKLFTPWDVIFMQYLLKNTECEELFEKCVAYAQTHRALCFYEKLPENGYKNVQFHVRANLSCYTPVEIRKIQETVADIVGCNSTEIVVCGYRHSSSFLVVLSIEQKHVKKLLTMKQQEKDKLSRLNIDYFIVDFIKVYLQNPQEIRGADDNGDYPIMRRKLWGKPTTLGYAPFKKHSKELDPVTSDIANAKQMTSISVSAKEVKHISCLMPNRCWVSDMKKVQEIDENGRTLRELDIYFTLFGSHTLMQSGDLLFLKDNDVFMLTSNGEVRNLFIHASLHFCIHCSRMNDDILIGDINVVTRYNILGIKLNQIEFDDEEQSLYEETIFITENKNGDIIVSDNRKNAIVVTNKSGRHLFNYKGHNSQTTFHPGGICTDILGHILVCNVSSDPSVHLLNQKGQFLTYLLTNHQHGSDCPQALCVDSQHNLYVGYSNNNRINVYSYLTNEQLRDFFTKEVEANTNLELTATRRKSYSDLNVRPTPDLDEKTNLSLNLNEKQIYMFHSVSETAHTKEISLIDSHNVEKRSNKTDSVSPITSRKSLYKVDKLNAKKTDSEDTRRKSHDDLNIKYAAKQKEWSKNINEESNVLFTKEMVLYRDKMFEEENTDNSVSNLTILPTNNLSGGRQGDSVNKMNIYDSGDENMCPLQQKPQASLKDQRYRSYNMMKTDDVVWPSLKQTTTATLKHPTEENYDTKEMDDAVCPSLKQTSKQSLKHPTEENYDTKEMDDVVSPSLNQTSTATLNDPTEENYDSKEIDDVVCPSLNQTSTATLKDPIYGNYDTKEMDDVVCPSLNQTSTATLKDPIYGNNETKEMDDVVCPSLNQTSTATLKDSIYGNNETKEMDDVVCPSLKQTSTATLNDPTEENYDTKERAPPIPPRKRVSKNVATYNWCGLKQTSTSILKDPTKEYYVTTEMDKGNECDMDQTLPPFQSQFYDYSSDVYFSPKDKDNGNEYDVDETLPSFQSQSYDYLSDVYFSSKDKEEETMSTFHQKSQALHQLPKRFEEINRSDKNYTKVQFHIKQSFLGVSKVMINAKDAICAIVGCHSSDTLTSYYDDSTRSVYLVIEELFLKYLLSMTNKDKDKLRNLGIDFFIVDFITVYLEHPKDIGDNLYHEVTYMTDEETAPRSKHDGASAQVYLNTAIHKKRLTVLSHGVKHMSCFTSNKMWISDLDTIKEIDEDGHILMKLDVEFGTYGRHTTRCGNLLFLKDRSVYILTSNGEIRNLYINAFKHSCIYASKITSDIFVAASNWVTRYSEKGKRLEKIQVDDKGKDLYGRPSYITENSNGDIIVSDDQRKTIVVVDKFGRHRFNYKGYHSLPEFNPRGICTDVFGHILVCNYSYHDPSVHLLDENGHFLTSLLTKHRFDEDLPQDVCVDDKHNLYVGCGIKNIIDVYKYRTGRRATATDFFKRLI